MSEHLPASWDCRHGEHNWCTVPTCGCDCHFGAEDDGSYCFGCGLRSCPGCDPGAAA